jgi:DNA-binding NarL/FixJ family response regulator
MLDYSLPTNKIEELRGRHRRTHDKREADRIKAVVLLAAGWPVNDVAEVLQVNPNTVRNHFRCYQEGGVDAL